MMGFPAEAVLLLHHCYISLIVKTDSIIPAFQGPCNGIISKIIIINNQSNIASNIKVVTKIDAFSGYRRTQNSRIVIEIN